MMIENKNSTQLHGRPRYQHFLKVIEQPSLEQSSITIIIPAIHTLLVGWDIMDVSTIKDGDVTILENGCSTT